ncbi:hypothetical protein [Streptococcus pneumoniae]|nr:hypothetical protein [Streptococcus pneumoniae]EHE40293.1 hypothetical protein SPAR103_1533 [Streptococcus pneumoniae GA47688]EHE41550.1 hypothetical protein SPAR106_1593 [Streptococcus pneumoniae GA47778]EHZ77630.1 hypothetical protein SPAR126_1544 [Streptococcus pneumoniae 8190-05]EHZ79587.1 hypothetical protein SPAR129_1574 [Streptococcus pneumoniae 7879-04]EHZ82608.1 hypothetical protein SPAR130_1535 [Streptococcus pneumoniae 5652-06]EHZ83756.1 hypothetical protein SPAR131_1551 [Strept
MYLPINAVTMPLIIQAISSTVIPCPSKKLALAAYLEDTNF